MLSKKGKLFSLKEWLTVPEAAKHLSTILGEEVSEADILRLALDKHLKLSVYFVNHARAKCGKVVPYEEVKWSPMHKSFVTDELKNKLPDKCCIDKETGDVLVMRSLKIDDHRYLNLDNKVIILTGVWDLCMFGGERLDVECRYQDLTDGPEVTLIGLDGDFVEREDGVICQLQESYDQNEYQAGSKAQLEAIEEHIAINNIDEEEAKELLSKHKENREKYLERRKEHPDADYYPGALPSDSVLVVRKKALIDLQERLQEPKPKAAILEGVTLPTIGAVTGGGEIANTSQEESERNAALQIDQAIRTFFMPDYDYWGKMKYWTVREACSLIININPVFVRKYFQMGNDDIFGPPRDNDSLELIAFRVSKTSEYQKIFNLAVREFENEGMPVFPPEFFNWALEKGFTIPEPLRELIPNEESAPLQVPSMDREHPYFSEELEMAIAAWTELYEKGAINPKRGHKGQIQKWLKAHYPKATRGAMERVATVVNPNKKGGAPSTD